MNAPDAHLSTVAGEPSPPSHAPLPVLPGYAVEALVGRGGMGKVYRARHLGLGRVVAVKVLALDPDEKSLARFRDEARAVAKLQHPHIAQVFDTGTADGRPFFAQEFLDGGSLAQKFAGVPQDPKFAAEVVEIVARAIQHSHDHGILHRDLKPGNILLAADGTPKVTDFGLAKELPAGGDTPVESGGGLTRTGEILGTPAYMPPEQASGVFAGIGPAADVYSLGAILYEAVTGRPPFQAPDALQTLFMVLGMDPVPPRTLQPKLPKDLETICLKCLEKSPRKRYPSAAALADDLHRFRTGEPILARPVGFLERAGKWARRKKAAAALLAVSVLFVLALVGGAIWLAITNAQVREANAQLESANRDLEKSKGETEMMLGYALNTMDEYHFTLADKLKNVPQAEDVRVEVLTQARDNLNQMYEQNPRRERVWEYLTNGYQRLGNVLMQTGDLTGAETAYRRSREMAERLTAAHPEGAANRAFHAITGTQLAQVLEIQGNAAEAERLKDEAEAVARQLNATHPDDESVLQLNVVVNNRAAMRAAIAGDRAGHVAATRRWAELYRRLAKVRPDVPRYAISAMSSELALAGLLTQQKKYDEANAILSAAKATLDALPDGKSPGVRNLRAAYHDAVANVHYYRDQPAEADAAYRRALAEYEGLAKDFPKSPNHRRAVVNAWMNIGSTWTFGGKPADGAAAYRTARDLAAALLKDYPKDTQFQQLLAGIESQLAPPPEKKSP